MGGERSVCVYCASSQACDATYHDVARLSPRPYCVGFAAESENLLQHAREKLARKNVPLIVGNLGPATFGRDDNALVLVDAQGSRELAQADKVTLARALVTEIAQRLA